MTTFSVWACAVKRAARTRSSTQRFERNRVFIGTNFNKLRLRCACRNVGSPTVSLMQIATFVGLCEGTQESHYCGKPFDATSTLRLAVPIRFPFSSASQLRVCQVPLCAAEGVMNNCAE